MEISSLSNTAITRTATEINRQESKLNSFQSVLDKAVADNDKEELKNACREFESYFLGIMFKEMRKTVDSSGSFIQKSYAEEVFQEMLDDETAKNTASAGGIGLADMMYKQLSREQDAKARG